MRTAAVLRIHDRVPVSRANGPGARAVLWVQGCTLACSGCFNPETHPDRGGEQWAVADLLDWLLTLGGVIEGVTVSGGEPLEQPRALAALLRGIRQGSALSTVLFTGYTWSEVRRHPCGNEILDCVDILISGRYDARRPSAAGLLGSRNQRTHFLTDRYRHRDLEAVPTTELVIDRAGGVVRTGIDPAPHPGEGR